MQNIMFVIGSSQSRNDILSDKLNWLCLQPPPRTLIASATSTGAPQTILVRPHGERTDLVTLPLPAGQTLRDGWVKVGFCIDGNGRVTRPEIKDSSPRGLYDQAAVAALSTWKFSGREVGGKTATVCGLSYEIPVIARSTLARGPAAIGQIPTAIDVRDLGGIHRLWTFSGSKVVVRFCVEKDGSVSHAEVVESKTGNALGPAALNVIRSWQFLPQEVGGKPVRACGIEQTIQFRVDRNLLFADPRELLQNQEWTGS